LQGTQSQHTKAMDLFSNIENENSHRKNKIGQTDVEYIKAASILTEAKSSPPLISMTKTKLF